MARRDGYPLACGVALLILVATYANHFHGDFHFDDVHTIRNNAYIRSLHNLPTIFTSAATFSTLPSNQSYRPLVTATLAVDYWLGGGLNPVAFHLTSFALFTVQCAVLVWFYRGVMDAAHPARENRWLALLAASWYAVHPANAETVNYIIARSEILSTLGVVLALVCFARGGVWRRYHLYLIPAVAGILGKEAAAMFAPLLVLYVVLVERDVPGGGRPPTAGEALRTTWPAFVVCFGVVAAAMRIAATYTPGGRSAWRYLMTQPYVMLHYARSLFLPLSLSVDTQWPLVTDPLDRRLIVGVLFVVVSLAAAWRASRQRETRPIAFGILWFFIALLPTSSVIPFSEPMNDHRMFFPFAGLILAVVWAAWLAVGRRSAAIRQVFAAGAVLLVLGMAYGTRQRNAVWRTEEALWLDATIKSPDNGRALMNYGVIQMNKGNLAIADRYFARALPLTPDYAFLHVNIAVLKASLGESGAAERHFREALRDDPGNPVSYTFFARWLASIGRTEEARLLADAAVRLSPADADARALLDRLTTRR